MPARAHAKPAPLTPPLLPRAMIMEPAALVLYLSKHLVPCLRGRAVLYNLDTSLLPVGKAHHRVTPSSSTAILLRVPRTIHCSCRYFCAQKHQTIYYRGK